MKIRFESPVLPKSGIFITFAAEGGKLSGLGAKADAAAGGHVARAIKAAKFEGKRDQMLDILAPAGTQFERIAVFRAWRPRKAHGARGRISGRNDRRRTSGHEGERGDNRGRICRPA